MVACRTAIFSCCMWLGRIHSTEANALTVQTNCDYYCTCISSLFLPPSTDIESCFPRMVHWSRCGVLLMLLAASCWNNCNWHVIPAKPVAQISLTDGDAKLLYYIGVCSWCSTDGQVWSIAIPRVFACFPQICQAWPTSLVLHLRNAPL